MAGLNFDTISLPTLIAFATTTFLLNITPGPAVMQVIGHSVSNGWKRAQASILGICAGNAVYCLLAVFGLGALILAVPRAFEIVKWCGVLYLCWLGGKSILSAFKGSRAQEAPTLQASSSVLFRQSLLVQAANPKSYLYFCALLPTFAGEAEGAPLRMAILGIVSMIMEYPVLQYPKKINSLNFDKTPEISGCLLGIKGQYLIMDLGVINLRNLSGHIFSISL